MHAHDAIERLSALAHDLWRDRMERAGWSLGATYDADTKRHDALLPFDSLSESDQHAARIAVRALDGLDDLACAIDYPRGSDRPISLREVHEGMPVRHQDTPAGDLGVVKAWTETDGRLNTITVRWNDGSETVHRTDARELARVKDPP